MTLTMTNMAGEVLSPSLLSIRDERVGVLVQHLLGLLPVVDHGQPLDPLAPVPPQAVRLHRSVARRHAEEVAHGVPHQALSGVARLGQRHVVDPPDENNENI